jgi:hypothetical protein
MRGAFYSNSIEGFVVDSESNIRDSLTERTSKGFYQQLSTQTESWKNLIKLLKETLSVFASKRDWGVLLEYAIPRRAKRIDAVLIADDLIFVIEYKDGETEFSSNYITQLEDYCLDLRDFHFESKDRTIIPVLLCPDAPNYVNNFSISNDYVQDNLFANGNNLQQIISQSISYWSRQENKIDYNLWNTSKYFPTPTIIEAAQSLYAGQNVNEISRSHAGAENLTETTNAVIKAIKEAQETNSKIICFITGVPGAGKTLAGLNIVHNREFKTDEKELGVFLSGNSPLVKVLSEALSRDSSQRDGMNKKEANRKVSTFIHNVHQFIDDYYEDETQLPVDKVLVYDEAQRAWTKEYKYFKSKKRINASEPEILLSIMNRFKDSWAVIIALVGGGQEINTGEGGLAEWGKALEEKFRDWKIYISPELGQDKHNGNLSLFKEYPNGLKIVEDPRLHLRVAIRSYNAEELTKWVEFVLSNQPAAATEIFHDHLKRFPIYLTQSLEKAKNYLKQRIRGSRRYGLIASSGARRLRAIGIDINAGLKGTSHQNELGAWYLNSSTDVRSSSFLEVVGSEFGVQGLELDWTCVCWDADLRRNNNQWEFKAFEGTKWHNVNQKDQRQFILNKYRVLLTRAREGMILFVPYGDAGDVTRLPEMYDSIYDYLKSCGVRELI